MTNDQQPTTKSMKIKKIVSALPIVLLVACSSTTQSSTGFELKGKLSNAHGETVRLELMAPNGVTAVDSVVLNEKGEFKLTPAIKEVGFYRLKISDRSLATLILDANQNVTVTGDAADLGTTYAVEGSADSKLFCEINAASTKNYRERDALQDKFQNFSSTPNISPVRIDSMNKSLEKQYVALVGEHNKYLKNLVEKNTSSFAALAAIQQLPPDEFLETYIKMDDNLFAKYPNSQYAKMFHADVQSRKKLAPGTPAPEIKMNTPDGKSLALSSLKGKIVLLDFWASWCAPCRAENPNVVKAYAKYKSKGFEVFSVSLDKEVDKWKQAIQKDNLSWTSHVSDLQAWQSPVISTYNFKGIPYNVLISKDGKILAKNLRGEELEKKLAEVFQ